MDPNNVPLPEALATEVQQLRQQLQLRDQLVNQLSAELFRMVKTHPPALAASTTAVNAPTSPVTTATQDELQHLEQQIEFYQTQIDKRDIEIGRLQKSCQILSERNQMLEHIIQELPEVYRQKFTDRLDLVKSKVQSLQTENRRLQNELQQLNTRSLPEDQGVNPRLSLPSRRNTSRIERPSNDERTSS